MGNNSTRAAALEQQRGKNPTKPTTKQKPTNPLQRLWKTPLLAAWCKVTELQAAGL